MTPILIVLLTFLVVMGRFLDFLVGRDGDIRIKLTIDRFIDELGSRKRSGRVFVVRSAIAATRFFAFWFGDRFVSRRAAFHCFVLSLSITSLLSLAAGIWDPAVWDGRDFAAHELVTVQVGCLIVANFVVDFIALVMTRWVLVRIVFGREGFDGRWLIIQIMLTYFFIVTTMNASFSSIAFARGIITGYFLDANGFTEFVGQVAEAWWLFFGTYTVPMFLTPIAEGRLLGLGGTNLIVFSFTACLPSVIYIVTIGLGLIVDAINGLTSGGVRLLVKKVAGNQQPIFLRLSVVASSLLALLGISL